MAELKRIGGLPAPAVAAEIWRGIWFEETHNSTAIEGNTLILKQVRTLLEEGRAVGDKELREYLEVQGYAEAAEWVYSQANEPAGERSEPHLMLAELREIHRLVVGGVWNVAPPIDLLPGEGPGNFRLHDILPFGNGMTPAPFTDIHPRITDWLKTANSAAADGVHPMEHVARIHAEFERIHPFRDGNGRTGRLAMNLILVRQGYAPAIIYKRDRSSYLRGLELTDDVRHVGNLAMLMPEDIEAQRPDYRPLGSLIARAVKDTVDRLLLPKLAGPLQMLPLSALARTDASTLALRRAAEKGRLQAMRRPTGWYSTQMWVDRYLNSRRVTKKTAG